MIDSPALQAWLQGQAEAITAEQIALSEIPAPTGMEEQRAKAVVQRFQEIGLNQVGRDAAGSVLGVWSGRDSSRVLVLAAHLDTVFPSGTDVRVRRALDGRLYGPGIGDNAGGLVALLTVARALRNFSWQPPTDILFFAPVGEEGLGDLRGTRCLLDEYDRRSEICGFLTLDCGQPGGLITRAVGSRRYRVIFRGPGGHSYSNFGQPSALHAACRSVAYIAGSSAAGIGQGTVNIGVFGNVNCTGPAGTSINSIAAEAAFEVDLRSTEESALDRLVRWLEQALEGALADERAWATQRASEVYYSLHPLGHRPGGVLPADDPLRQAVYAAYTQLGLPIVEGEGSTDANIPLSRGIPALAIWRGGTGDGAHTLNEWFDPAGRELAVEAILDVVLGMG